MVSSNGLVNSLRITFFSLLENIVENIVEKVQRKKCQLDPLTGASLMPDVISHWGGIFCFYSASLFHRFDFYGLLEERTADLIFLTADLILPAIINDNW